ncbi:MAG: SAM-dependent methyltransferase [Thermoplasmata archaeon]|nr:MAG: SAM-dependent methyltransferase [Thermoplasmata archaeon]
MSEKKTGCMVCGEELIYTDEPEKLQCVYCKNEYDSNAKCSAGHFVCDSCHALGAVELIEQYCQSSSSENPLEMAVTLMKSPRVKMHGPEHHFLVPAVLLTAYYNIKKDKEAKLKKLKVAKGRSEKILGGFCGFYGTCGAAVGTGIFISLITDSTPLAKEGWRQSNLITARSLETIANHGGPRCCKRNTYWALREAVKFLDEHFGVKIEINENIICEFNELNKECLEDECRYYQDKGL